MNKHFVYYIALLLCILSLSNAITCRAGRAACVGSCIGQNCATGYCQGDVCVCSRCGSGPVWPK